jgi:hypothetical protein
VLQVLPLPGRQLALCLRHRLSPFPAHCRHTQWLILAAFGPLILMTLYLLISRGLVDLYKSYTDWVAEALSCISGVLAVAKCAPREWRRVIVILIYLPLMGLFLPFYGLVFVCAVFRNCL